MSTSSFSKRLRMLRKEREKRQDEIADVINVTRANVSAYELDKVTPPYEKIKMLADYFGVSFDYMVGDSNERSVTSAENKVEIGYQINTLISIVRDSSKIITIDDVPIDLKTRKIIIASLMSIQNILKSLK